VPDGAAATEIMGLFDDPRYARIAIDRGDEYRGATPFPHIAIDDFLPIDVARHLASAFPGPDDMEWIVRDNENNRRRYQHDETKVPPTLRAMLREMNSRQFVLFIEEITGIENLMPDPFFIGGGVHMSGTGDFLNVHADFNWHHKLQAYRRTNALLYLTEDWQPEWQGAIEFWDEEMTQPVDSALPLFNRLVIFTTGENSNHGQRLPNACPEGVYRKVLNLYYYTARREDGDMDDPHFTLYKQTASQFATDLVDDYRKSAG
jgi:Rps23 Pro-64 3,4-dihydroxylase Tpa1-like proline 4-hydroxylase